MALDLSKLARSHDFDLATEALGTIQCGSLSLKIFADVEKCVKKPGSDAADIARQILGMVGRKAILGADDAEPQAIDLTEEDIRQVSDLEIERFAQEFVTHNEWLKHYYDDESRKTSTNEKGEQITSYVPKVADILKDENETASQYLIRVLDRYFDGQSARMKNLLGSGVSASSRLLEEYKKLVEPLSTRFSKGIFNDSALESMRRNLSMSDQLQDTIKAFKQSTLDHDIARASIEPDLLQIRPLSIPDNPLIETNRRLGAVLDQMQEMRPLVAQSAELIRNMNDTALKMQASFMINARSAQRYALVAIVIATLGLVASSIFSWLSYIDGKQQSEKNNTQTKLFETQIRNLISAQDKDRAVLVDAMKEARQSTDVPKREAGKAK
ncbi:hypothetical protein [Thiobacillus denitrificans]|uniref:hypothetical protein n=1 Tax=Thiobacillus denitrificans TaxID=36861 RepID=UPI0003751946|nr:hypothetical protein [Thiobacillus denitrificans]